MFSNRRFSKRKRFTPFNRSRFGYRNTASRLYKMGRTVKFMQKQIEKKIFSIGTATNYSNNGSFSTISSIAQGTDIDQRVGDKIFVTSMRLRLQWTINTSATASWIRFVLLRDKQFNGILPISTMTDIFTSARSTSYILAALVHRFDTIFDQVLTMGSTGPQNGFMTLYRKKKFPMYFQGTGITTANSDRNAWIYIIWSSEATNTPGLAWDLRARYVDS